MAALTHSSCHILHNLCRPSRPQHRHIPLSLFLKPISSTTDTTTFSTSNHHCDKFPTIPRLPLLLTRLPIHQTRRLPASLSFHSSKTSLENSSSLDKEDGEFEEEDVDSGEENGGELVVMSGNNKVPSLSLTVKEKKELASYAHGLGDKLKSQLVGKSGVTPNLASSFIETLQANELLKIKVHRTCPGELDDVIKQLEEATGSVAVGQIGRTVIVYKPSLKKLQVEEKRKQAARDFVRKDTKSKPFYPKKKRGLGRPGRVGTGSRRFS